MEALLEVNTPPFKSPAHPGRWWGDGDFPGKPSEPRVVSASQGRGAWGWVGVQGHPGPGSSLVPPPYAGLPVGLTGTSCQGRFRFGHLCSPSAVFLARLQGQLPGLGRGLPAKSGLLLARRGGWHSQRAAGRAGRRAACSSERPQPAAWGHTQSPSLGSGAGECPPARLPACVRPA